MTPARGGWRWCPTRAEPARGGADPLTPLAEGGWGVVALPQPGMPRESEQAVLAAIADQLATFLDDGYEVALAGPQDERTARLLELLAAGGRRISGRLPLADPGGGSPDHDPGLTRLTRPSPAPSLLVCAQSRRTRPMELRMRRLALVVAIPVWAGLVVVLGTVMLVASAAFGLGYVTSAAITAR